MQTLDQFLTSVTEQFTLDHNCSIETAVRLVEMFTIDAQQDYRKLGAPLGDTDAGFLTWLRARYQSQRQQPGA